MNGPPSVPSTTSMLGRGVDARSIVPTHMKCCFYGDNRLGKTTILSTFPKPLALFSFEPSRTGGAESVSGVEGIRVFRRGTPEDVREGNAEFTTVNEAVGMARELKSTRGGGFATVGLDSGTSLEWTCLEELMREAGRDMPTTLTFGTVPDGLYPMRSEKAKEVLREFIDIPCHVVVTAKEKDHNPPKEERRNEKTGKLQPDLRNRIVRGMQKDSYYAPALGFSAMSWLLDACGYVGRCEQVEEFVVTTNPLTKEEETVNTGRRVYALRCRKHHNYAAGFRVPEHLREQVTEFIVDPTYEKILAAITPRS
jgi:hypothetical protein